MTNIFQNGAPRIVTHEEWKKSKVTPHDWKKFSIKYTAEMKGTKSLKAIRNLGERAITGK